MQSGAHKYIASHVRDKLLADPHRLKIAEVFSKYFRTSNYVERLEQNSKNWYLFLRPQPEMRESFGLEREVVCFVSDYHELEVRTLEAAGKVIDSAGPRLEQDVFFLISDAPNALSLSEKYTEEHGRRIVVASWRDILAAHEEYPKELLRSFFYRRDLFNQSTAVSADGQFFARYKTVDEIFDNLRNKQNCAVFGLRKIGKTSVLQRVQKQNDVGRHFTLAYLDAQLPQINTTDAGAVAVEIVRKFNAAWAHQHGAPLQKQSLPSHPAIAEASRLLDTFMEQLVKSSNKPALLIVDELERILPSTARHTPWRSEYLHLWRLLRSIHQALEGRFVFLVASTNPYFAETSEFDSEDNPLYRFFKGYYLQFFSRTDLEYMLCRLGKPMDIEFSPGALDCIFEEYGGHPFLSRRLCSDISQNDGARPLLVTRKHVNAARTRAAGQVHSDISGILKVFSDFYPLEYDALRMFARDKTAGRREFDRQPLLADHLAGYGLVSRSASGVYDFTMNSLESYFDGIEIPKLRAPEVPAEVMRRHFDLQTRVTEIELALRALVMTKMREEHGTSWQSEIMLHLSDGDISRIDSKGKLTANAFMEELYFPQLLQIISGRYSAFIKTLGPKPNFKEQVGGAEVARNLSDHRKLTDCGNDALYLRALEATEFFYNQLALG